MIPRSAQDDRREGRRSRSMPLGMDATNSGVRAGRDERLAYGHSLAALAGADGEAGLRGGDEGDE